MRQDRTDNLSRFEEYLNTLELPFKTTWAALADKLNISERTLRRYRIILETEELRFYRSKNSILISRTDTYNQERTDIELLKTARTDTYALRTDTYESENGQLSAPIRNTPLYSGVGRGSIGVLSTTGVLNKCTTNVLTEGEKKEMIRNKNQTDFFPEDEVFNLDNYPLVSVLAKESIEFPRQGQPVHIAVVWYWAVERFRKYGYDTSFTAKTFAQAAIKYSKNIMKQLGKNWEEQKKYVDWYLEQIRDDFIVKECKFNFNYFTSPHCLNKFFDAGVDIPYKKGYVETVEERRKIKMTRI